MPLSARCVAFAWFALRLASRSVVALLSRSVLLRSALGVVVLLGVCVVQWFLRVVVALYKSRVYVAYKCIYNIMQINIYKIM